MERAATEVHSFIESLLLQMWTFTGVRVGSMERFDSKAVCERIEIANPTNGGMKAGRTRGDLPGHHEVRVRSLEIEVRGYDINRSKNPLNDFLCV